MRTRGYTLIELLVVISIISIMSVVGFVNFKGFSSDQVTTRAAREIQTLLKLAQSNATSSTFCGASAGVSWSLIFRSDQKTLDLACGPTDSVQKTHTLENAEIESIIGSSCSGESIIPLTLSYSPSLGELTFKSSTALNDCLKSSSWTLKIKNKIDTSKTKEFKINRGGAIDVQ